MVAEGKGEIIPAPLPVILSEHDLLCIIQGAIEISRYNECTDTWKKGLLATAVLPRLVGLTNSEKPIVGGKCGEYAFRCVVPKKYQRFVPPIDFKRRAKGDGGIDLRIGNTEVQIKTRVTSRQNLVRITKNGMRLPLVGEVFVFCEWRGDQWAHVLGWIPKGTLVRMPVEPSRCGRWDNFVVDGKKLLNMSRLWAEISWRVNA